MKKKQRRAQIALMLIGSILFALTYLYYPNLNKESFFSKQSTEKDSGKSITKEDATSFENLEFKGLYDFDKPFTVQSEEAYILNKDSDLVYMKKMYVILHLSDNRIVEIRSLKGRYNKENYDCFFEDEVVATDGETTITAENLDLLATKSFVEIYNNVSLDYITGSLKADKIDYNFETRQFSVSMFDDSSIKMKVIR